MVDTFEDIRGLSAEEVAAAVAAGDANVDAGTKTRSIRNILREKTVLLHGYFCYGSITFSVCLMVTGYVRHP